MPFDTSTETTSSADMAIGLGRCGARQLNNQISPDASVQAVNVNLVKDFLSQGDTQGKLSAQQWNEAIDVTPAG